MNNVIQKGGYSILNLRNPSDGLYENAKALIGLDKPILVYLADGQAIFADETKLDNDDVLINIGGRTYTITDSNEVTYEGDIQVDMSQYAKIDDAKKYYLHNVTGYCSTETYTFTLNWEFITDSDTSITTHNQIVELLTNMGIINSSTMYTFETKLYPTNGYYVSLTYTSNKYSTIIGSFVYQNGIYYVYLNGSTTTPLSAWAQSGEFQAITDSVTQI